MRQQFEPEQVIGSTRQPGISAARPVYHNDSDARTEALTLIGQFQAILARSKKATAEECRLDLNTIRELRGALPVTIGEFEAAAGVANTSLLSALHAIQDELPPLEQELRQRLASLTGANPADVDLSALRQELAERAARRELGESVISTAPPQLEIPLQRSSLAGIPMLIFGFGWLSFTTFHAILMIGGMSKAFGGAAFFLLGFYAIFFTVGFGMLWSGISAFRKDHLVLLGNQMTLHHNLFGYKWEKQHTLDKRSRAWVTTPMVRSKGSRNEEMALLTADGRELRLGNGLPTPLLYEEAGRINDHIHSIFGPRS